MAVNDSNTMSRSLTLADLTVASDGEPRVEDIRLAEALEMERPREIRRLIERHRQALERLAEVCVTVTQTSSHGGRPGRSFWLNKRQALYLCTKSEAPRATEVTIQMVEVFDAHLSRALPRPDPDVVALNQVLVHEMPAGDFAFLRIGRRTVMVDMRRFRPGPKDEAVLLHPDGRVALGAVQQGRAADPRQPRAALEKPRRPRKGEPGGTRVADVVQVLGVVIKPQLPALIGEGMRTGSQARTGVDRMSVPRRRGAASLLSGNWSGPSRGDAQLPALH